MRRRRQAFEGGCFNHLSRLLGSRPPTFLALSRIEVVVHNTQELQCGRSLEKFPRIVVQAKENSGTIYECLELHRSVFHR